MPTFYKRKRGSCRGEWTETQLNNAANAVKGGQSLNQAAKTFGIPWTTLKRRITTGDLMKKSLGPLSILGPHNEHKIAKHIIKMQKFGFSPTRNEVRSMAYNLAEQLNLKHKFNRENQMAGLDWLHLFLKRNPILSIRKSEGLSLARSRNMNKEAVSNYFELLQDILVTNNLVDKPGHIYNVDESGLQLNNKPGYVVAKKGSKSVTNITASEKGETISVIACCNGEGVFLPPACVFKGKNEKAEYKDGMPPGSVIYMCQKSAYVNTEIFDTWLKTHFYPRKVEGKVLLILDGHSSHCSSVATLEFAEAHDIILLCLPSHTTHYLQPLDRAFFKALKTYYYNACNVYMKMNPNRKISRLIFGKLLSEAWVKAATAGNALSGFKATGISPFNPHAIPEYAFVTTNASEEPYLNSVRHREQTPPREVLETTDISPLPCCSTSTTEDNVLHIPSNNALPSSKLTKAETSICESNNGLHNSKVTPGKLLDQISPVPVIAQVEKVRKNSRNLAAILNSNDNIESMRKKVKQKQEKQTQILARKRKGKKAKVEKNFISDTESESSKELELQDDDDDDDDYDESEEACIGCGEIYKNTKKTVDWIKCIKCNQWLHEDCTKFGVMCNFCGKVGTLKGKKRFKTASLYSPFHP